MDTIRQTPETLEFVNSLSPVIRILLALFGFVPLLAPYELLIKPSWQGGISFALLFFLVISLGAILVSLFLFTASLLGRSDHFQFNAPKHQLVCRFTTAFNITRQEIYPFNQIESLEIKASEWESRPDTYDIVIKVAGQPEMSFGDFPSRQGAERYLKTLQKMLGREYD